MYFRFMVHYCVSFKYYRWITSNFLQCNCPRKANTTLLHSKNECKFSPGRTPLGQQQNAELKFSAGNKEEKDSNKPRSRENIALPSEKETVDKRQRRGYKDYRHVQTAVIVVFFRCLCIQFNSILFEEGQNIAITTRTKPMKRKCHQQDSQRKRPEKVEHFWKFLV